MYPEDQEKEQAFTGLCAMVMANPGEGTTCHVITIIRHLFFLGASLLGLTPAVALCLPAPLPSCSLCWLLTQDSPSVNR